MEQEVVKKKNKVLKIVSFILFAIFIAVCGVIIFFNLTHEYFLVVGPSMMPTLNNGVESVTESKDGVFVSKIKGYTRGDIVVLNRNYGTENKEKDVVKRVIALEGDKINVSIVNRQYRILIIYSGETEPIVLEEEYILNINANATLYNNFNNMTQSMGFMRDEQGFILIPQGTIFCLGDNRANSIDSSTYGVIDKDAVIGKVDYIIYNNENTLGQLLKQIFGW